MSQENNSPLACGGTRRLSVAAGPTATFRSLPGVATAPRPFAAATDSAGIINAMTVDVEDYFHVQAFANAIDRADWERLPRRVEQNTERLLDEFAEAGVSATFFTLGWVAERHPRLVRRIVEQGHELASHGYAHIRADQQNPAEFRADVRRAKRLLEDAGEAAVRGYRAATFSIGKKNWWAFEILGEEGYAYSSSIFPVRHDLYGVPDAPRHPFRLDTAPLTELPLTTVKVLGRNLPCAGGGYFRLLPYRFSQWAMRRVNRNDGMPCIFYLHPWEIDPGQPRQRQAPLKSRLRHYTNLSRTQGRLRRVLREFRWGRMDEAFRHELASRT
jgi:polysaccharide deacetylase family protein (PEP-CTERM system associated)